MPSGIIIAIWWTIVNTFARRFFVLNYRLQHLGLMVEDYKVGDSNPLLTIDIIEENGLSFIPKRRY